MDSRLPWMWAYRLLGGLALAPALAWTVCKGRFGGRWADRLGYTLCGGGRPLWIHGASVGEAQSALHILASLPAAGYSGQRVLSVGTPAGLLAAQNLIWPGEKISDLQFPNLPPSLAKDARDLGPKASEGLSAIQLMAQPLDFWGAPARCLARLDPSALVIVETEIWPELLFQCQKRRLPVAIVSGRMSQRSAKRFQKAASLIGPLLGSALMIAAATEGDRERFLSLGVSPARVKTIGSPKFDPLIKEARARLAEAGSSPEALLLSKTGSGPPPLIVAGSTHPGEEELILQALSHKAPGSVRLILAPRHESRAGEVLGLVKSFGLKGKLLSEMESRLESLGADGQSSELKSPGGLGPQLQEAGGKEVVVIDQVGLLARLYQKASLCLVGGSFFRSSGHNPLEPAAYGRPVVFGPGMDSFAQEAKALVEAGAAREAAKDNLRETLDFFLSSPEESAKAGLAGLKTVASLEPVAPVLAKLIVQACYPDLSPSSPGGGPFGLSPEEAMNGPHEGSHRGPLGNPLGNPLGDPLGNPHSNPLGDPLGGSLDDPLGLLDS